MRIEYFHASKYGNGAAVAEEFKRIMAARQDTVHVHHVRDADPKRLPEADLYVFSSPGRMGKPIRSARRFLKKARLPAGAEYAILTTELEPQSDPKAGRPATQDELGSCQRMRPIMNELLAPKHLRKVAEGCVKVTGMKGPLEDGWQRKVEEFAASVSSGSSGSAGAGTT